MVNKNHKKIRKTEETEKRIPAFKTIEEEAAFWDTHDSTEFEDQFEDVTGVRFVKSQPKKAITVRLEADTIAVLRRKAREKGVGLSTLARIWLQEHLREEEERNS